MGKHKRANLTNRLSVDQRRQEEENARNPSAWSQAPKIKGNRNKVSTKKLLRAVRARGIRLARVIAGGKACEGRKKCHKEARYSCIDDKYRCDKCYRRFRREWARANIKLEPKKQPKPKAQSETERRKAIFKQWDYLWLKIIRRSPEYKAWRESVLEQNGQACEKCGVTDTAFHVHHKRSAHQYPDEIFDVSNGAVLCVKCHTELHITRFDSWEKKHS